MIFVSNIKYIINYSLIIFNKEINKLINRYLD